LEKLNRPADAAKDYGRLAELVEGPQRAMHQFQRVLFLARAADSTQAVAEADVLAKMPEATGDMLFDLARICAWASTVSKDDDQKRERNAARAVALLRQATERGFGDLAKIKSDDDLRPLRDRQDFKKLLQTLVK
jgi:hypothetical protein